MTRDDAREFVQVLRTYIAELCDDEPETRSYAIIDRCEKLLVDLLSGETIDE